jgi:hypothetical protein
MGVLSSACPSLSNPYLSIQEVWWGQNRPGTTFCDRLDFGLYRVFDRL